MKKNIFKYISMRNSFNKRKKISTSVENYKNNNIDKNIEDNIKQLKYLLGKSEDVIFDEFNIKKDKTIKAFICFIDGLVDKKFITEEVIKVLREDINCRIDENDNISDVLKKDILNITELKEITSISGIITSILSGEAVLFIDNCPTAIVMDVRKHIGRSVEKPDTEGNIRGSREGFTETLRVNTSLIRKIIKNPKLIFESLELGSQTNTKVCIAYIEGIADNKIVKEVRKRLAKIDISSILESGYIEQLIDDSPFSIFSTIGNSERPDKIAAKLLEGRVAIICDGTPFVLSVPYLFIESFQVSEDYYSKPYLISLMRCIRVLAFIISLTLPSVYIAIETFHQEMIPTVLILTAAAAREGTPFPTFVEVIVVEILFLLLREGGIRMPKPIGQTVSFIGALIIGQSAVQAGIISAPMVIIGSVTAIASFIIPQIYESTIFFRFLLISLSTMLGFHGIILGIIVMVSRMCSLKSFGVPYLQPIAPTIWKQLKDSFIRFPLWSMNIKESNGNKTPKNPDNYNGDGKNG
ncbi:spore germination protein [Clostridium felsineum]|uniref:spore germination protein n=1 Tax=Clostridium felsineum TaxID=36839 RepID=UPI00214D7548|nr:spore germination protein [Clostridium felsineum]MCR3760577.1 spore germination protein [Clostridium felsineum]